MSQETSCHTPGCGCHATRTSPPPVPQPFSVGPGFVLKCLGGVALLALIVYVFVPLRWLIGKESHATRGLAQARFIYMTLNIYASDNVGEYPQLPPSAGEGNANLVYQQLVPHYLTGYKESFHREGSAWTPQPAGALKSAPGVLAPGENHYAYVTGLSRRSNPRLPLVADGFSEDQPGVYSSTPGARGYLPEGKAVFVRVDGSGSIQAVNEAGRLVSTEGDPFAIAPGWLTDAQKVLNPAK